jgi:Lon protease-like protein
MSEPAAPLTPAELEELPVFPLPNVVLFPGTRIALHIFEPRYRAMMEHCLSNGPRAMAIALLKPGFERDYEGQPPIHTVAGAGRITAHRKGADGTFDLLLESVARVRLIELPFTPPFRRARCTVMHDEVEDRRLALEITRKLLRAMPPVELRAQSPIPLPDLDGEPGLIADLLLDRVLRSPARKQELLENTDVIARLLTVAHELHVAVPETGKRLLN